MIRFLFKMTRGILTMNSSVTDKYYTSFKSKVEYPWDGSFVGKIDHILNKVSTTVPIDLFYCVSGYYYILIQYTDVGLCIEKIKEIYNIPRKKYNICIMKGIKYFMYECEPDNENPITLTDRKKLNDDLRYVKIFHWLFGIKGKFWEYTNEETNEHYIMSQGPYDLNYTKHDMSEKQASIVFVDVKTKYRFYDLFNDNDKIEQIEDLLYGDYTTWLSSFKQRLSLLSY